MSNRAYIIRTKFIDTADKNESYGVRVFDDYDQSYINRRDELPDSDMELLREVIADMDEPIMSIINSLLTNEKGLYIDDRWYDYEEIKDILTGDNE